MQTDDQGCNRKRELAIPRFRQQRQVQKNRQALDRIDDAEQPIVSLLLLLRKCSGPSLLAAPLKTYRCGDEEQNCSRNQTDTKAVQAAKRIGGKQQLQTAKDGKEERAETTAHGARCLTISSGQRIVLQ